jgi:hypothetical protein
MCPGAGERMDGRGLPPETRVKLRILLDRLASAGERCREGLYQLASGDLSQEAFLELLREQQQLQECWERTHRKHFSPRQS